jgi:hypothetical protein
VRSFGRGSNCGRIAGVMRAHATTSTSPVTPIAIAQQRRLARPVGNTACSNIFPSLRHEMSRQSWIDKKLFRVWRPASNWIDTGPRREVPGRLKTGNYQRVVAMFSLLGDDARI